MENKIVASVVISIYNGESTVKQCLRSVLDQDLHGCEVIAVDCSTDTTPCIIREEFPEVRLAHFENRKTIGEARNIGVEKSKGTFIFFLDADCVAGKNWISEAIKLFEGDKELKGLCLAVENYSEASIIEKVDFLLEFYHWLPCQKRINNAWQLTAAASAYRKEVFSEGKFKESYIYGEDVIFSMRLANKGYKLLFEPSAKMINVNIRRSMPDFLRHQIKVGRGSAYVRREGKMPSGIFLRFPPLIFIAPFYIVPKMGLTYVIRKDLVNFVFFLKYFPLFFIGNFFWAAGFYKEAMEQ
ncbi:glycosyltransferase [Candidatus Omnitrophota bacterium]